MSPLKSTRFETETILNSIEDSVVTIGLDKKIRYLNRAAERLFGFSLEEAQEMSCADVIHCSACDNDCLLDQTVATEQDIRDYETLLINKAGEGIAVRANASLLRDNRGQVWGGVEVFRDCREVEALTQQLRSRYSFDNLIGKNHRMQELYRLLPEIAKNTSPVLLHGEPGTGKELMAHGIHSNGPRSTGPFVKIHSTMIAHGALASELFGHVKGAFPGDNSDRLGRIDEAEGGTLFLDEVGELDASSQERLLQVIKTGDFYRTGDTRKLMADVRFVTASSQDLKALVEEGRFLRELYDLLCTAFVDIPPLRERREDIPLLVQHYLKRFNADTGKSIGIIGPETMSALLNYDYPGNIEELEGIMAHAVMLCHAKTLLPLHLPQDLFRIRDDFVSQASQSEDPLKVIERQLILKILSENGWNYRAAAEKLNLSRTTFWRRLKSLWIERPLGVKTSHSG